MADQDIFLQRVLLEEGLVDNDQLKAAHHYGVEHGVDFVDALVQTDVLTSRQIALTKAEVCKVPFVELADFEPCYANTALVPRNVTERYCAFSLFMVDGVLTFAMDDPLNLDATDQIRRIATSARLTPFFPTASRSGR